MIIQTSGLSLKSVTRHRADSSGGEGAPPTIIQPLINALKA